MSAQLTCLSTTLRELTVEFWNAGGGEVNHMFSIVQPASCDATPVPGCLSMLQRIKFSTFFMSIPLLEQIIGGCAKLFGSTLDVLNVDMNEKDLETGLVLKLASLFEPFKNLRVVGFTVTRGMYGFPHMFSSHERARNLGFALPLARSLFGKCATLREVWMNMSTLKHAWIVTRTPDGRNEHCPSDDCTGHLIYVPNPTSSTSRGFSHLNTTGGPTAYDS
jgi:hypothetical protein